MAIVRNETQQHSTALKSAGQSPVGLLPLNGVGSVVPSFQLHPVFRGRPRQVLPSNTMSRFVGFGDKSRDSFKKHLKLRVLSFCFCLKVRGELPLETQ